MELKLGKVLKRELKTKGIRLKDISDTTGISISLLSDWKESRAPSSRNLPKVQLLADFLNLSLSELLFSKKEEGSSAVVLQSTQFRDGDNEYRITIEKLK